MEIVSIKDYFSNYSRLKSNISKCEITGIGGLRGVHIVICGLKSVDILTSDTVEEIQNDKNFCKVIFDIQNILKLWMMQSSTNEGKIAIFKALALSKVVCLAFLTVVPNHIIDELITIQTNFIWKTTPTKAKHRTLILDHKQGGLKCADAIFKIISLQCSWLKRLFDYFCHEWKVIPLFYIKKTFGNSFKLCSNLDYKLRNKVLYKKLSNWMIYCNAPPDLPSCI